MAIPTNADGYIDAALAEENQRIWDVEDHSDIESIDGKSELSEFSSTSTRDIQREWDENMEQLRQLVAIVIVPYAGRWLGKKFSHWVWAKYIQHHYKFRTIGA
ncbi:hypothetical protein B0O80DRAFT_502734 [Mortierella sp. GBAus27b]|nr:hypothetical protein BGX31_006614 [Mortierella sp. GBA43]KAI8347403.1 hypothetical protein B0O80DRAFT_502734 [Mortierella sp. GBAus27b]